MENQLVSIIIPAYQAELTLSRCLDSLLDQSYSNLELLVVDDGSRDRTPELCDSYAQKDNRIRVFHIENGGVSNARNIGLREAQGELVMFVDSDDYVKADYVECHCKAMAETEAELVVSGYYFCYPESKIEHVIPEEYLGLYDRRRFGEAFGWLYGEYYLNSPWNKLYQKRYIQEQFQLEMNLGEDLRFNLTYLKQVSSIYFLKNCCYYYMCDVPVDSLTKRVDPGNLRSEQENLHLLVEVCREFHVPDIAVIRDRYAQSICSILYSVSRGTVSREELQKLIQGVAGDSLSCENLALARTASIKSEILRVFLARRQVRLCVWFLGMVSRLYG